MTAERFLDTNILLYSGSRASEDAPKRRIAETLVASLDFAISTQVIQEYIANALRKKQLGLSEHNVQALLDCLDAITVLPVTLPLIRKAWALRSRYSISHWDATIIAAAQELDCRTL
jgi:predicted nucleic acid-binding protein